MNKILRIIPILLLLSCSVEDPADNIPLQSECLKQAIDQGKVFYENDRKMLWGGNDDSWHFDITGWPLKECQLKYGLGREAFHALIEPEYITVEEEMNRYHSTDRFIILLTDDKPKVYSINLLATHEVINENVNGDPVMVVYCVLADLAAVYTRKYCDTILTFALSGYTYSDPDIWDGTDAFVLWDRETESLWWPLIDEAVSAEMKGATMLKYNEYPWWEITWSEIINDYPDALVMACGQTMSPPQGWPRYEDVGCK